MIKERGWLPKRLVQSLELLYQPWDSQKWCCKEHQFSIRWLYTEKLDPTVHPRNGSLVS